MTRRENKNEATKGIFLLLFTGMSTRKHSTADEVSHVSGNHNTVAKIRNEPYLTPIITLIP